MRVLSLNVAQPRSVTYAGRPIDTGIFKQPVAGRRALRTLGIEGDAQADLKAHGGVNRAVYAYDVGQLGAWSRELDRELTPGAFGENLTVSEMPDDDVRIGDRYRIGGALLEVSQPRNPCFKLGIALDDETMPSRLVSSHRPGFYLRVLSEGEIGAGDAVELVYRDETALTVAAVNDLLWLTPRDRDDLARAAATEALSAGWRDSFAALLRDESSSAGAPAWAGFRDFVVTRVVEESATVRSFHFAPSDGGVVAPFVPGQSVTIRIRAAANEPPVVRTYSLSSPRLDAYRITVRRAVAPAGASEAPPGRGSTLLHESVKVGDVLGVGAPRGTFTLADAAGAVALVSAGVGITPMIPMLAALVARNATEPILFAHTTRNDADDVLLDDVRALAAASERVTVRVVHSRADTASAARPGVESGRLTAAWLRPLLPPDVHVYLCGPPAFLTDVMNGLVAAGVPADRLHAERFGSDVVPKRPPASDGTAVANVTFARSQRAADWSATFANLLEFAESLGIDAPYACRAGICQTCATDVIAGDVEQQITSVRPPPVGRALICCSIPTSDLILDL